MIPVFKVSKHKMTINVNVVIEWFKKILQMSSLVTLKDNPWMQNQQWVIVTKLIIRTNETTSNAHWS